MMGRQDGQATVELLAWFPLVVAVVLAVGSLLAAGAARELAGHAAQAGAVAILQGDDPAQAAREALPGWSRKRVEVRVRDRVVRVRVAPPVPVSRLADALATTATADAGPAPR
jgi:hypothetical protein